AFLCHSERSFFMSSEVETSLIISPASPTPSSVRQHSRLHPVSTSDRQCSWHAFDQSPARRAQRTSPPPLSLSAGFSRVLLDNPRVLSAVCRRRDRHERYLRPPLDTYHSAHRGVRLSRSPEIPKPSDG